MMNKTPLSIITATYNDPPGLRATLESLKPFTKKIRFEQVIVDGSSEKTAKSGINFNDYAWPIRLIHDTPLGIYRAMNTGVLAAEGRVLWFLNGGDEAGDLATASKMVDAIIHQGGDLCAGDTIVCAEKTTEYRQTAPSSLWTGLRGGNKFCHQAVFFSAALFSRLGEYSDIYKYAGDYEYLFRAWKSQAKYIALPGVVVRYHRGGASDLNYEKVLNEFRAIQLKYLAGSCLRRKLAALIFFYLEFTRIILAKKITTMAGTKPRQIWRGLYR